jgi:hypothetical protein
MDSSFSPASIFFVSVYLFLNELSDNACVTITVQIKFYLDLVR